jgi:hypothetical protein
VDLAPDFKELLAEFARDAVDVVIVGGYAVAYHGRPRATKDIDLVLEGSAENSNALRAPSRDDRGACARAATGAWRERRRMGGQRQRRGEAAARGEAQAVRAPNRARGEFRSPGRFPGTHRVTHP